MTNLLAQRQEIKRLEKLAERRREDEEDEKSREDDEARLRAIQEFEAVQMGLEVKHGTVSRIVGRGGGKVMIEKEEGQAGEARSKKRKFEIDEEELSRIAAEERSRAKLTLDEEKRAAKAHLPSFWVPSQTPDLNYKGPEVAKLNPTCPCSEPNKPHALSLKTLACINFNEEKEIDTGKQVRTCPSCRKALTNSTKAMVAIPCGHVLCKPCVEKFLKPEHRHHRDAHDEGPDPDTVHCYVCDMDLTTVPKKKDKDGKKSRTDKEKGLRPGLVEIRSEGTGFAGGGKNIVKREGVAFQV